MKRTNQLAFSVLTSFTVLSIGFTSSALAETTTVTRGPNGAAHQVKADSIPLDAQVRRDTSGISVPKVITRGPNFAAHRVEVDNIPLDAQVRQETSDISVPKVSTRGPNFAAHTVN